VATHEYRIKLTWIQQFIKCHVVKGPDTETLKYQKNQIDNNKYDMLYVRWFCAGMSVQRLLFWFRSDRMEFALGKLKLG